MRYKHALSKTVSAIIITAIVTGIVVGFGTYYGAISTLTPPAPKTVTSTKVITTTAMKTVTSTVAVGATTKPQYTFYFISHGGPGDPWWAPVIKGAQLAGKLLGVKVVYEGPKVYSVKWLVNTITAAAAEHPDGIIVTITNYKAEDQPLRQIIKSGIPVIAVNVYDPRPPDQRIPYMAYVGQDEYQAGYALAEYTINWFKKHLGHPPTGAVIGVHEVGHIGLELRAKGMQDAFKKAGLTPPPKLYITTDFTKAYNIMKSYLTAHPKVDVIFTLGPLGAHPAMKLIEDLHLKGKVYVSTMDLDSKILEGIKNGVIIAGVSQQPFAQGFIPVVLMYLYVKYGIKPPEHFPTGPTVIDQSMLSLVQKQISATGGA